MELRDLKCFLAVAEASGFRRAALQIRARQSVVSRRIRFLEDHLGVSLFERHRAGARLTHAGAQFLQEVRPVLTRLDSAERAARSAGEAGAGSLRLGVVASFSSSFLNGLLRDWIADHSGVTLALAEGARAEHIGSLRSRQLDVAFVAGLAPIPGCDIEHLWSEPILAALPNEHVLISRSTLSLDELMSERFLVTRSAPGPELHDFIVKRLSDLDRTLRIDHFDVGLESLMSLVGIGLGVSLVTGAEAGVAYPRVTFVPIAGQSVPFSAVWAPDNDNPALRRFLSDARLLSKRTGALSRTPDPSP